MAQTSKTKVYNRIIAVGDVHGCYKELEELLGRLSPNETDLIIFLGDLINRGPDSHKTLELARSLQGIYLLGNHEQRFLNYKSNPTNIKTADQRTFNMLTEADWAFLQTFQLTHYEAALDTIFVHGGFLPSTPWDTQDASVVTQIQVIDQEGLPRKRAESPYSPHWSRKWNGPSFVVYGHTPSTKVRRTAFSLCLDTGCVYGGHLTACVFPEKRLYQVKALQTYLS